MESASFAERLGESFTSLIRPCRYTSYETSSTLRPTTMLFGCPLPDELDGASIGQRTVAKAFETILSSAATKHPHTLYQAICDAQDQSGNDTKLSALQLESLWDPSQPNGGLGAVNYLANAPSSGLLVYFLTRLPQPIFPLDRSDINMFVKLDTDLDSVLGVLINASNKMGTARRCNLARLFLTLRKHQLDMRPLVVSRPEGVHIFTRVDDVLEHSWLANDLVSAIMFTSIGVAGLNELILPQDSINELKSSGLLT